MAAAVGGHRASEVDGRVAVHVNLQRHIDTGETAIILQRVEHSAVADVVKEHEVPDGSVAPIPEILVKFVLTVSERECRLVIGCPVRVLRLCNPRDGRDRDRVIDGRQVLEQIVPVGVGRRNEGVIVRSVLVDVDV